MGRSRAELVVILGALIAGAPMSIDMYLSALPALERAFAAGTAEAQRTVAAFLLGFAGGQAFYGPLVDRFGRKKPLYVGFGLFVLASAGCALAPSIGALTFLRFLQALGACAGGVVSRAMVRDLFDPRDAARVYSTMMLVIGIAPILAPIAGGYVLVWFGWEAIFWTLAAYGCACLVVAATRLPETHRAESAVPLAFASVLARYRALFADRRFMGYALAGGLSTAGMFAYIAGSPFVFIDLYGVAPQDFGWLFGSNALGFVFVTQVNRRLLARFTSDQVLRRANAIQVLAAIALVAAAATGAFGLAGVGVPLFVYIACLGCVLPNTTALAMAPHGENAGMASALLGTLQFGAGALAATLVGLVPAHSALPMAATVAAGGVLAFACHRRLVGKSAGTG